MEPVPESKVWAEKDLHPGVTAEFVRDLQERDIADFAGNSGDYNPLHIDGAYARVTDYGQRIAHGAFQLGLASCLIGMHLPGRDVLLTAVHARFPTPLYYPTTVCVRGELTSWMPAERSGNVRVTVSDVKRKVVTAEIAMLFILQRKKEGHAVSVPNVRQIKHEDTRDPVIVSGAAGGLGSTISRELSQHWPVLAIVNRTPLPDDVRRAKGIEEVCIDLTKPEWEHVLEKVLDGRRICGLIHAAWPAVPRGGLLELSETAIENQIYFGSVLTMRLARFLAAHASKGGARLWVISSTYATYDPRLQFAGYSLGKSALEQTVRLLAPELALKNVTINALAPSFMPSGMNKNVTDFQLKKEVAKIPLGRLCSVQDVADYLVALMQNRSNFLSGQIISLTGGQI